MAGFPTKFSESISCGVPVITTQTSDLSDYLQDGITGFWLEKDIEKSVNKIFKTKDIQNLKRMKKNINSNQFYYKNYVEKFEQLFQ